MAKRLIYAEDALENIDRDRGFMSDVGRIHARNAVNEAPTVEQKKGRYTSHEVAEIIAELHELEMEITKGLAELEEML